MPPADPLPTAQAAHAASLPRGVNAPWPIHPSRQPVHHVLGAFEPGHAAESRADVDEELELEWASERDQWDSQIDDWDLAEKPSGGCSDVEQRWQQLVAKAESDSTRSYTHPAPGVGDVQQKTPYVPQVNKTPRPNVRALLASPTAESHNQHRRLPPLEDEERTHATDTRALLAVPQRLQTARSVPPTRAIIGALIVGLLACAVVFARWWFTERQAAEHTVPAASAHSGQPSPSATAATADKQSQTTPAAITVHVAGKVTKPGVVTVPAGSRASQAIAAAGGFARGSDARSINMAKPLSDGEQIIVAALGEAAPAAAVSSPGTSTTAAGKVNLNSADQTTLETLPGVGPVMAGKIIKWRTDNGRFTRVEDLNEVSGVGEKTFAKLSQLVTV